MSKDFGPVSGYLDPAKKSWEQVTWRTGRPPLDKEFNLAGELSLRQANRSNQVCSGFLFSRDYYSPDVFPVGSTYIEEAGNFRNEKTFGGGTTANTFYFGPAQVAHVGDMLVNLQEKNEEWLTVTLPAAPTGVGVKRWDFVFIEVWRAPITGDVAVDTANGHRDANGKIFYNGWVDSPTADNFVDDVLALASETSRRVQVQWRIRVVADVDMYSYPDGLDDTTSVFAQGPDVAASAIAFSSLAAEGDPGLWVSTGHSTTNVSVDGSIYAIPLCAVPRRNQSAWAQDTNQNGGTGTSSTGLAHDYVSEEDIHDIRKTVSESWDLEALLNRNFAWLLDGKLKTDFEDHNLGGGGRGTYLQAIDEVGPVDTPGATLISEADGYRKHFSDAVTGNEVFETLILTDRTTAGAATYWQSGDVFDITLPVASDGLLTGASELALYSGHGSTHFAVSGLNTKILTITLLSGFDTIPVGERTNTSLFVKVFAAFPGGAGLSRTPYLYQHGLSTFGDITTLATGSNLVYESVPPAGMVTTTMDPDSLFFKPSRTATLVSQYTYTNVVVFSRTAATTVMPNHVRTVTGIYDGIADPGKTTNLYLDLSGDNLIQHTAVPATHRSMIVDYTSKEPMPASAQVSLYYRSASQQALNTGAGGLNVAEATVHMLYAPDWLYTITAGSGGHNPGYPYVSPASQIPSSNPALQAGDHQLDFDQTTSVDDFGTDGGLIRLPVNVPMAYTPYLTFKDRGVDGEGRNYYESVKATSFDDEIDGSPVVYQPSVHGKRLQGDKPHRVVYPTLAMCLEDSNLGKRGTLLLLVFTRTSDDDQNAVSFTLAAGGDSCVALYRLKGNPIVSPRKYQIGLDLIK